MTLSNFYTHIPQSKKWDTTFHLSINCTVKSPAILVMSCFLCLQCHILKTESHQPSSSMECAFVCPEDCQTWNYNN